MPEEKMQNTPNPPSYIIAVGSSAGGLEAISEFLVNLPENLSNFSIVVAQHLSPSYKSRMVELLAKQTVFDVLEAQNGQRLEDRKIYITPPDREITIQDGYIIRLTKPTGSLGPKPSVDILFQSVAILAKEKAIGVILSGTGNDGSSGLVKIKEHKGLVIAQLAKSAKYDGMPLSAKDTHKVDLELVPARIGHAIARYIKNPERFSENSQTSALKKIIEMLSEKTEIDFFHYKQSSIGRRIAQRIQALKLTDYHQYIEYSNAHPEEFQHLLEKIIVGVTSFFRDMEVFDSLKKELSSTILQKKKWEPFRIWVPGCASGEEVYSVAILIHQICTELKMELNIQIFGTDIDERAINTARTGIYPKEIIKNLPSNILNIYFQEIDGKYEVKKFLKNGILFSKHDITGNPPFLKIDFISCRNLLLYLDVNLQQRILPLLNYSLNANGILLIGRNENPKKIDDYFKLIDSKNKIYTKEITNTNMKGKIFGGYKGISPQLKQLKDSLDFGFPKQENVRMTSLQAILDSGSIPFVVLSQNWDILELYGEVNDYLEITPGLMNMNIKKFIKPEYSLEIISAINHVNQNKTTYISEWKRKKSPKPAYSVYRIKLIPLSHDSEKLFILLFESVLIPETETSVISDSKNKEYVQRNLELEKELISTKQTLQTYIEELETSNEELQTVNEELMSTNEELQATNEELETTNEELQSTNEELQTAYSEMKTLNESLETSRHKLKKAEANLRVLIDSSNQAFLLISKEYFILEFNKIADLFAQKIFNRNMKKGDLIFNFVLSNDMSSFKHNLMNAFSGNIIDVEKKIETDKEIRWLKFTYNPVILDKETEAVALFVVDITEKKKFTEMNSLVKEKLENEITTRTKELIFANKSLNLEIIKQRELFEALTKTQKELELSEERYKILASSIPNSDLILFDKNLQVLLATGSQLLKKNWNKVDYKGKLLEAVLEKKLWKLLLPLFESAIEKHQMSSEIVSEEKIFSITTVPILDKESNVYGGVSIIQNVTNARIWEIQSHYNENILTNLLDSAPIGICLLDENLTCKLCNEKFLESLTVQKENVLHNQIQRFFPSLDELTHSQLTHNIKNGKITENNKVWIQSSTQRYLESNWSKFSTIDNHNFYLILINDITNVKLIEFEIKDINTGLQEKIAEEVKRNREMDHLLISQSRFASMGEMIGNIAHQWRQPLSSLTGIFQNLLDAYNYGELNESLIQNSEVKFLSIIEHMSKTIDDFRDFFRPKKDRVEFNLIKDCLEKSLIILENRIKKNKIEIIQEHNAELIVYGFPGEISQVIINILNNALDAFEERNIKNAEIRIKAWLKDEKHNLSIRDNAGGIPEDVQNKIFDPYFTTKSKGTGIGLYMSKMIIEKSMQGNIEYQPIENGSEFTIILDSQK
jgi:chemotaxis methyl-accepting protein methylase/signal transduction histidine kinase